MAFRWKKEKCSSQGLKSRGREIRMDFPPSHSMCTSYVHGTLIVLSFSKKFAYDIAKPKTTYPTNEIAVTIPMYGNCATA